MTDSPAGAFAESAWAKVNLWLHVLGRRADGCHLLDSLAVFPDIGDVVEAEPSPFLSLTVDGPFAAELGAGLDNLVLRAADGLGAMLAQSPATPKRLGAALRLEKRLPVAGGIGGGSADAAATLKLLMRLWRRPIDAAALFELAISLGADVPACLLAPEPVMIRGVGEQIAVAPVSPAFALLLVNPGAPLSTPQVFEALAKRDNPPPPDFAPPRHIEGFISFLEHTRNDLEAPALTLAPSVGDALAALRAAPGCRFARMSGSGATCFGVFATLEAARAAEAQIRSAEPSWWLAAGKVGG